MWASCLDLLPIHKQDVLGVAVAVSYLSAGHVANAKAGPVTRCHTVVTIVVMDTWYDSAGHAPNVNTYTKSRSSTEGINPLESMDSSLIWLSSK